MITNPIIPIELTNDRTDDFSKTAYFCDIDKTYLDTKFETLGGLISTLFDFAIDKVNIKGMDYLLRGARHTGNLLNQLYFISASPKEMRNILNKKLTLDGIQFDGMCLRNQLFYIKKLRFKDIRNTFSFKLLALLIYNGILPENTEYVLIGDNTESDSYIYTVFKNMIESGKINENILKEFIKNTKELQEIVNLAKNMKKGKVIRIYINKYIKNKYENNENIIYFDNPIEVMLDLYKINKMAPYYIKQAVKNLNIDINTLKTNEVNLIKEILKD